MIKPKLRFKADDGSDFPDWEEKALGDFVNAHVEKTSDKNKYPLYSLTIEAGVQPKTERYEREFLIKKDGDNYKIVPPNAFVYNPMNLRFGALKVNHEKFSVCVSGYYDVFSLKDESILAFWENYLVMPRMLNYYFSIATGSLIEKLRVHYAQFIKIEKYIPSISEQQKIADFLSSIDTVISNYNNIIKAWEERKKGLMQKLFSQKIRFKDDNGNKFPKWKERKLGDTVLIERGGSPRPIEKYLTDDQNGFNWIKIGDAPQYGNYIVHTAQKIIPAGLKKTRCVHVGDLILSNSMSFGKPYILEIDGCIHDGWLLIRDERNNYNKIYLCYLLGSEYMLKQYKKFAAGTGVNNLNKNLVANVKVLVPCIEEQQKIADCLSALDDVINDYKKTLAAWKELKKGLLQQMFV